MATDLSQLLNWSAVSNKLGGNSNSSEIPNRGQISSTWGSAVYFDYYLASNNKVIPNNGQIWPVKPLKSGSSPEVAYNANSYSDYVFKNTSWDEDDPYDYSVGNLYQKTSASSLPTASVGYYMENDNYTWYRIASGGAIAEVGYYIPNSFSFTNGNSLELGTSYNNSASHSCSSSSTSTAIRSQVAYNISGTSSISGDFVNASINNAGTSVTFTRRSGYNSSYPMVVVEYGFSNSNDLMLIHPPWNISASYSGTVRYDGDSISPAVSTNMAEYWFSSNESWITPNGSNITISLNNSSNSRTGNATIYGRCNDIWGNVAYDSGSIQGNTFTITQEGKPATMLYVVWFPSSNIKSFYLVSSTNFNWSELNNNLVDAPQRISIEAFKIHVGLGGNAVSDLNYTEYSCSAKTINTNGNNVTLTWTQETQNGSRVYHQNGSVVSGTVQLNNGNNIAIYDSSGNSITSPASIWMGSAPDGYSLYGTVVIK